MKTLNAVVIGAALVAWCGIGVSAPKDKKVNDPTGIEAYVSEAKAAEADKRPGEGSLWDSESPRADLFRDFKARYKNDVLTIRVLETTQALAAADAKSSRSSELNAGFDSFFGLEKQIAELPSLVSGSASGKFKGDGSTSRQTTLQTSLTARITEVLPNGYLVVQGAREIRVNNENQTLCLSGIVRPEDISRDNIVSSSRVAQMTVRLQGKGVVSQPLKPGWLYRILMGILPF